MREINASGHLDVSDELLFVVDENDNPLIPLPRKEVIEKRLWRRTAGAIIVDSTNGKVLCQRRSDTKDERPGVWIAMFGGKSAPGEEASDTLVRELQEELGIMAKPADMTFYKKAKSEDRRQFEYRFIVNWSGEESEINFDKEEVAEIGWFDIPEVISLLEGGDKWYSYGYDIDMLKSLL